jgi:hypothetical protein
MPRAPGPNRHFELLDQRATVLSLTNTFIECGIDLQRSAFADLISGWVVFVHGILLARCLTALMSDSSAVY